MGSISIAYLSHGATHETNQAGIALDGVGSLIVTDHNAGTMLHELPGGAPDVFATIALGAVGHRHDAAAGQIAAPITPGARIVALAWSQP